MNRLYRRGFTFVELCISMAIVTLIACAAAGITCAVAEGWQSTETTQALQAKGFQSTAQLYRMLRGANYVSFAIADGQLAMENAVFTYPSGKATLMFWTDANGDGLMQASELAVLQRDSTSSSLKLYTLDPKAANAGVRFRLIDIRDSNSAESFKKLPNVTSHAVASSIGGVVFKAYSTASTSQRQIVEFTVKFTQNGQNRTEYGTACVRASLIPKDK